MQKNVLAESQEHNDLVVEDFHDVYLNLTMKTGFLLKWLSHDCPDAKFVLKVCVFPLSFLFQTILLFLQTFPILSHLTHVQIIFVRWMMMSLSTLSRSGQPWSLPTFTQAQCQLRERTERW